MIRLGGEYRQLPLRLPAVFRGKQTRESIAETVEQVLPVLDAGQIDQALIRLNAEERQSALRRRIFPAVLAAGEKYFAAAQGVEKTGLIARAPRKLLLRALIRVFSADLKWTASEALHARAPILSARRTWTTWQILLASVALFALAALAVADPPAASVVLRSLFCTFFSLVVVFKFQALLAAFAPKEAAPAGLTDGQLPVYSVLVPLFKETSVLEQIVGALEDLDYPPEKLDIKLVIEQNDWAMVAACAELELPQHMEIIEVPDGGPQTKPKALNFALPFARGGLITIYDAEDIPDRDQLRIAAAAFAAAGPDTICMQAELRFFNAEQNWLTRQFAIEYASLFEYMLPALGRWRLPMPLGGTSNHFRTADLRRIGAWDPFNVTEDADLGLRVARLGGFAETIPSVTHEEATSRLANWMRQRARWQKGYLKTWLVHMRQPRKLREEVGLAGFWCVQAVLLGAFMSALLHPAFIGLMIWDIADGTFLPPNPSLAKSIVNGAGLAIFLLGYLTAMTIGAMACARLGRRNLWLQVPMMPLYWLLISMATWRGLWDLIVKPHHWHKTEHGHHWASAPNKP